MKASFASVAALALASAVTLGGCADSANSTDTLNALKSSVKAEHVMTGRTLYSAPVGKSYSSVLDGGRQFMIATKTGNVDSQRPELESDCAKFDVIVSRPSRQWTLFGKGDSSSRSGVKICLSP